jgi:hypothetical protein
LAHVVVVVVLNVYWSDTNVIRENFSFKQKQKKKLYGAGVLAADWRCSSFLSVDSPSPLVSSLLEAGKGKGGVPEIHNNNQNNK